MATFNKEAAIRAGYTEQEIQQFMKAQGIAPRMATPLERAKLSFGDAAGRDRFIKERNLETDASGTITQPKGFDIGDVTSKAGGILPLLGNIAGATAALPAAAAVGIGTGGLGLPASAGLVGLGGGVGAAGGETLSQGIGNLLGVREGVSGKEVATEGAIGTLSAAGGEVVSKAIAPALLKTATKSMRLALNPAKKTAEKLSGQGTALDEYLGTSAANKLNYYEEFVKQGYKGTVNQLKTQAQKVIAKVKPVTDKYVAENADTVIGNVDDVVNTLAKIESEVVDGAEKKAAQKVFNDFVAKLPDLGVKEDGKLTLKAADTLRAALDKATANLYLGTRTPNTVNKAKLYKLVADVLRKQVNESLPETVRAARFQEHIAYKLFTAASEREFKKGALSVLTRSIVGGLGGAIGIGTGGITGFALAGPMGAATLGPAGGALGGTAGLLTSKALASPVVRTGLSQLLKVSGKAAEKIPAPVTTGILNVLGR